MCCSVVGFSLLVTGSSFFLLLFFVEKEDPGYLKVCDKECILHACLMYLTSASHDSSRKTAAQRHVMGFINTNIPVLESECMSVVTVYGDLISTWTLISV